MLKFQLNWNLLEQDPLGMVDEGVTKSSIWSFKTVLWEVWGWPLSLAGPEVRSTHSILTFQYLYYGRFDAGKFCFIRDCWLEVVGHPWGSSLRLKFPERRHLNHQRIVRSFVEFGIDMMSCPTCVSAVMTNIWQSTSFIILRSISM